MKKKYIALLVLTITFILWAYSQLLIEAEIIDWILQHPKVSDFSTEVLPHFVGRIATWQNENVLRDIGSIDMLRDAQSDNCFVPDWPDDSWNKNFLHNPIHQQIL